MRFFSFPLLVESVGSILADACFLMSRGAVEECWLCPPSADLSDTTESTLVDRSGRSLRLGRNR